MCFLCLEDATKAAVEMNGMSSADTYLEVSLIQNAHEPQTSPIPSGDMMQPDNIEIPVRNNGVFLFG